MSTGSAQVVVRDNSNALRYELLLDGEMAGELRYRRRPDAIALIHTEVSQSLEGRGLGAELARRALDDLRARGLKIVPICPFVRAYIRRHPEYEDLVVERAR
jgi:predicted GNAT family acetyltransferase